MNGARTLIVLLVGATVVGVILFFVRPDAPATPGDTPAAEGSPAQLYVEKAIGLPFRQSPVISRVPEDVLVDRIGDNLDAHFGPGGLAQRTRAFELLGLLPSGRSLRGEFLAMEAGGQRGWFDDRDGTILVPGNFDETDVHDQALLCRLLSRELLRQHAPPVIGTPTDDNWIARRAFYAAIASLVEGQFRSERRDQFDLPTAQETEREAIVLSLPLYIHNLAQIHLFQGRDYLLAKREQQPLAALAAEPPTSTMTLLGGDPATARAPQLPTTGNTLLEESLGAYAVQILLEWLADYDQARALALDWQGDRYRLLANGSGDHLLWVCRWKDGESARRAAAILNARPPEDASRKVSVTTHGPVTVFANCSDQETLDELLAHDWGASE